MDSHACDGLGFVGDSQSQLSYNNAIALLDRCRCENSLYHSSRSSIEERGCPPELVFPSISAVQVSPQVMVFRNVGFMTSLLEHWCSVKPIVYRILLWLSVYPKGVWF